MKIGILVDSSTGYLENEHKYKNVRVIPLHLIVNDKDDYLDTPEDIKKNNLIKILGDGHKTSTSQASPGELMNKYEEMLKEFDHIIHMTIPYNLSGMHQTAVMISNDDDFKGKVTVIENCIAANCAQLLTIKFAQMAEDGIEDPKEYQKESDRWGKGSFTAIIPSDLQKMSKGGRASSLLITMLKMMKTKVGIQWLDKPKKLGMGRTYGAVLDKMISALRKELKEEFVLHFVTLPEAKKTHMDQIRKYLENEKIDYVEAKIPNVYPWHAGIDTIGLIAVEKSLMPKK
ncbi:DegV family protein [Spiroplasma sp. BIUS-1]|uniref:DegV family protein n=1 Tax=Spiroplasma sp. BIUS-1 TaxID=216964 RepID=UPI0013979D6D|nr:DegV family protein [Spiroplasma sp. BIUS-1]QHX36965.1 fatty acid-binding protein DegV [Spiroplasma sp. BIUS-1]